MRLILVTLQRAEAPAMVEVAPDGAWDAVIALERHAGQQLFEYAVRLGVDGGKAADLVQEALIRLWRELGRGTMVVSPRAWAFRTVGRLAMDEHRLHRRIAGLVGRLGARLPTPAMETETTERVALWTQVDRLPARQRQVIHLRYQADLSFEEIGHVMDITSGAARTHATAALRTLRARLGVEETGD